MYFCYDCKLGENRPKLENALMDYALSKALHRLFTYPQLASLFVAIDRERARLLEDSRNNVDIYYSQENGEFTTLNIGEQSLSFIKVVGNYVEEK